MNYQKNLFYAAIVATFLTACSKPETAPEVKTDSKPLSLVSADILQLQASELARGPMVSGSLQPVVKAELNAEVSGIVTKVLKDNGDLVKAGELLVQLDQTTFRDKLMSAQEAERSALVTADQAQKQLRRMQSLHKQNLVTAEVLESAEIKANQAHSELASAKARLVEARQQMERTEVRAPFDGVVAMRKTSAGDTAQIGKALMVVIDPSSMRFEGYIAADQVGQVKVGQAVNFKVNGYNDQRFDGVIERINPQAAETTRQVQLFVAISNKADLVAGLYAEGYIAVANQQSLMVPPSVLVQEGDNHFVWQLTDNKLHKVKVDIGAKDPRWGTVQLLSGVNIGDQVLLQPLGAIKEGASVTVNNTELSKKPETAVGAQAAVVGN
ncbi:efflux RND transporter periplasmic adaptor subunit [Rheinheimera sp.]|uniref:efflux RND transporter periplasmic adaptor subunit n=1 Tax=Rheinheimera sp. TaxID=1869214 RepID=UPI0027B9D6AE|nr:efflux RND transporter periplasmic adaptor subunit [Rheinheimera sp.]